MGKTTLAVHVAHRLTARFPDGCLFLDLHGYTRAIRPVGPGQGLERLLRALGVPGEQIPADLDDRAALYRSRTAGRRLLIVLDNARTAEQVRLLLPAQPGCLVLVTSRRRLTALDEALPLSLDILPVTDAATLFSRIAGPGRTSGHSVAVERVVEPCGRLPLAIRIAAARLRARSAWTVAHLADRLADHHHRLGELDDGERGVAAAFALSYEELAGEHQHMFRRLSLHPGADTDPYAAAALAGLSLSRAGRILEDLLDAHLLLQAVPGRYRFHDLMRAYAADLARQHDADSTRRAALTRLFDHYLATAGAAMDTLFPAGIHAAIHGWPGHTRRLSAALALYLDFGGHFADALTIHTHARDAAARCGDFAAEANALISLGTSLDGLGRHARATEHLLHALHICRAIGHRAGEARALNNLGYAHCRWGRHEQAMDCLQQALSLDREIGNRLGEADALSELAIVHREQGRYPAAADCYRQAVALFRRIGNHAGERAALRGLDEILPADPQD